MLRYMFRYRWIFSTCSISTRKPFFCKSQFFFLFHSKQGFLPENYKTIIEVSELENFWNQLVNNLY